tara:strand:+ start:1241 stop:1615 length:375 start_codon:yes stop_codon:yes gene_type:complete
MNNIHYKIYENENLSESENEDVYENNYDNLINEINLSLNCDHKLALETDYNTNYNIKQLKQIIEYYNISLNKRKSKKQDLIDIIINFELNNDNKNITNKRKQLWFYMKKIKEDDYLNKFIIFEI